MPKDAYLKGGIARRNLCKVSSGDVIVLHDEPLQPCDSFFGSVDCGPTHRPCMDDMPWNQLEKITAAMTRMVPDEFIKLYGPPPYGGRSGAMCK